MNFSALNTHAIGVQQLVTASAVVEGAGSFSAAAGASAQVTLHSHAIAVSITSVAVATTQSVIRFAAATATMGCNAAANTEGYRVQFSNAEIVCTASSDANAVVQRQAVVYVTAQATNVAVGSRVAYASASLQAECNLTANSGKVIFASAITGTNGYWTSGSAAVYGWSHYQNLYVVRTGQNNDVWDIAPGQNYWYSQLPRTNPAQYRTIYPAIAHGYNSSTYYRYQLQNYAIVTAAIAPVFIETAWQPTASLVATATVHTVFYGTADIAASAASSATASNTLNVSEDITASAVVTSLAYKSKYASANITGSCALLASTSGITAVECHVAALSNVDTSTYVISDAKGFFTGSSVTISIGDKKAVANTTLAATAAMSSSANVYRNTQTYISASATTFSSIFLAVPAAANITSSCSIAAASLGEVSIQGDIAASSQVALATYVLRDASGVFTGSSLAISVGNKKAVSQTNINCSASVTTVTDTSFIAFFTAEAQAELLVTANITSNANANVGGATLLSGSDTQTFVVTASGGNYVIANQANRPLDFKVGSTYTFDLSSSSNGAHPLRFSTTNNGVYNGGTVYTDNVTISGTQGQAGSFISIVVTENTPSPLYYYCANHSGMGGTITVSSADDVSASVITSASSNVAAAASMDVVTAIESAAQATLSANAESNGAASNNVFVSAAISGNAVSISIGNKISIGDAQFNGAALTTALSYTAIPVQSNIAATASITTSVVIEKSTFATFSGIANTYSTAITSNYINVNVQANASLAAAGLTGPAIYASADISDTGYWTAAVYHPEISTPGYWTVEQASWVFQGSSSSHKRTGPNGPNSGNYVSGPWWWNTAGTSSNSGETTSEWRLQPRPSWQDPYWAVDPGPVYLYYVDRYVVSSPSVWVPPVVTQAAYTTPAFWTDTGFGPDAELTTANVEIILGSSLTVIGSADITTLPYVAIPTSAVIAGSSELIEQSAVLGTVLANAIVIGAAAISGIGFKSVYAQGSFLGSNITISTGTNTVLVSAVISTSAEVIAAAGLIRNAQASIEASASILPISGENFRRFADSGVITGSAEVVGSSFNIVSVEGIFLGSTLFISTGANTKLGFANITANADLSALPSLLGTIEASVIARAEIEVVKYVEVHVSANIAATTSLNAVLDVVKISQALIDITASSTVTCTAGVIQDDAATIAASASIIAIGGKLVSVTADVSDTGYWTPPYNSAEAYTEPAYDTHVNTPAAAYWVNNVNSQIQISSVWISIAPYYANTTYSGTNIPTTILNTLNNAAPAGTTYYTQLSHAQTRSGVSGYAGGFKQRVTTTHPPVYVPAVVVDGYWTVTGLGPTSNITATAEVMHGALFSATANVEGSIYLESTTTLNIEASTAITATDYVDVYVDGAFTGSNVTITAGEILIFASGAIEASATITAEADRSVIAKAFIEGSAGFTSQGAGLNVSEARVTASAEVAAEVTVLRYVAVPLNIDATVIITTRFVLLAQEGQRSNGILILVEPEIRALAIEVKKERVIYAKVA